MSKFVIRRLVQAILVIIAATFLIYVGLFVLGDPFSSTGERAIPPATQAALRLKFGMDKPFIMQYLTYLKDLFTFDLGIDFDQRREVSTILGAALPQTAKLAGLAILIDVLIGVTAGIVAAVWRYSFWDALVTVLTTLFIGVPTFVIALTLRFKLSGHLFFPIVPHRATLEVAWWKELILPSLTLAIVDAAFIARLMRGSMLEVLRADYIRTARAKGITEWKVIMKHAFRNSIIPVVTYVGISLGVLMGGAIITESIFQYEGLGYVLYKAIQGNNNPVILPIVIFAVIAYVVLSTVVDILYATLDPRIRLS